MCFTLSLKTVLVSPNLQSRNQFQPLKKEEEEKKNLHFEVKWTQTQIPAAKGVKESKRRCSSPHSSQADGLQEVFFPYHSLMSYKFKE